MAQQLPNKDGVNLSPSRYTEQRSPQFTGGSVDPETGNIVSSSRSLAAKAPSAAEDTSTDLPPPAQATTRLNDISAAPYSPPKPDYGAIAGQAAISAGASAVGKAAGSLFSSGNGGTGQPSGSSSSYPNAGGFASGGGSSDSSGTLTANSGSQSVDEGGFNAAYNPPASSSGFDESGFSGYSAPAYSAPAPSYSTPPPSGGYDSGGDSGGGGDGSVICTELHRQGLLTGDTYVADQHFGQRTIAYSPHVYAGYLVWAKPTVTLMRRSKRFTRFVNWFAAPWAQYMAIRMGRGGVPTIRGAVLFHAGWFVCGAIGAVMNLRRDRTARA